MSSDTWQGTATQPVNHPSALEAYGHLSYEPWLALAAHIDHVIRSRLGNFNRVKDQPDE